MAESSEKSAFKELEEYCVEKMNGSKKLPFERDSFGTSQLRFHHRACKCNSNPEFIQRKTNLTFYEHFYHWIGSRMTLIHTING